jgi:adenylate cyclase
VSYVVQGSVRRALDRVRITAQLIDATSDVHVWSESYERELSPANIFEIQSDIAQQVSNTLQVQLREWEGRQPTDDATAWDLYLRARYLLRRLPNRERTLESYDLAERAVELDPDFASAHAVLALHDSGRFISLRDPEWLDRAETHARRALALDPQDAMAHMSLAVALQRQGKHREAVRESRRAIELDPSEDYPHTVLGISHMALGEFEEARRAFHHIQRLNPVIPTPSYWMARGTLHYLEGDVERAVELWEQSRTMSPLVRTDRILLIHHYESAGRHEEAGKIAAEILSIRPDFTAETGRWMMTILWNDEWIPEDLEANLRKAGLP